ncbi:MAG: hypothetical protein R3351_04520, partial [Nitrospirales bacterium]|nr:hypothetical protein [Nitrospirales bacterium]
VYAPLSQQARHPSGRTRQCAALGWKGESWRAGVGRVRKGAFLTLLLGDWAGKYLSFIVKDS